MSTPSKNTAKKFFILLFKGRLSEAERILGRMKKRLGEDNGYYRALYGIYYAYVNDDRDSYVFKLWERFLNGESKRAIANGFRELITEMQAPPREYLQAWLDLISLLDKLPTPHKIEKEIAKQEEAAQSS